MLLFRSEEHLQRRLDSGHPRGETMSVEQQWKLAGRWFAGRDRPGWTKLSPVEGQEILREVGLTSEFWRFE